MEKIHIDPNMENDNTEHIRGKRLSSILKAPRNPLDDLGSGNELTQDLHLEKRRKNSRRVSFANTIDCRVFQRDLKNNTAENPEGVADTESNVLVHQHEDPDAVPCKITGMNTLLHAPIQAAVQQTEEDDVEDNIQTTSRHNTTLIFTEDNEMDMTSSHTAVITRDLKSHSEGDTGKIDITSFLAGLNSSSARAEGSREFTFFPNPANGPCPSLEQEGDVTAVKKINFNEFLKSLKSNEKAPSPAEGPDKENVFCDPSQASGDVAGPLEFMHPREPPGTCSVTRVFRGQGEAMDVTRCQDEGMEMTRCQDEGMEMARCQASAIQAAFSAGCAAPPQPSPSGDVTQAFADDGMDMTTSHTAKVSFPFSSVGNQSVNCKKDFPSTGVDNSVSKTGSNQHLLVQHEPRLGADRRTVPAEDRQDPAVLRAVKQEARTMAAIPGSISSETVFRGDRSVLSSRCDDMEMTGNYTDVIYTTSTREVSSSPRKAFEKPVGTDASLLAESRDPALPDRGVPKSLVSLGDRAPVSHRPGALGLSSGSGEPVEQVTRAHGAASGAAGFDSCTSWVSAESKLQHRPGHPQPLPLPAEKTVIFSGEDMDLTKTCFARGDGRNDDNEIPAGVFTSVTCKPQFLRGRSSSSNLNEQEEMEITKCHAVVIDDQSSATAAEAKQMHCKIISRSKQNNPVSRDPNYPDMDKENLEVISIDGNTKRSQTMGRNSKDLEVIIVDKKPGKTNFEASGPSSYAKNMFSLQEQRREDPEHSVTSTCPFVSMLSQKAVQSKPLEKSLLKASVPCSTDKTGLLPGEQNMDRARTPPAAFAAAPAAAVQEYEPSCSQSSALSKQQQNQTLQQPGSSGLGLSGQVAATERGDLKMNPNKQAITPVAPSGSCISSKEPPPCAGKGNTQPGAVSGVNAGGQNLDRQEKPHSLKAGHKALPSRAGSEGDLSAGRRGEDFEHPCSVGGLHSRGAEEPPLANPSEPRKGSSQLPLFSDQSVVFPAGESMECTGNSVVLAPEYNCSAAKAVPGCLVQEENKIMSLKKGSLMSLTSQQQPACEGYSLVCGRKASATRGLTHFPFAGEKTTIFSEDADMDLTRSHTVSAEKMILQSKNTHHDVSSIPGEKTCLFTNNNDMEMSKLDTVVIDKPVGKAAAQGMFNTAGRKSLRGTAGEKTVLFLLDDENNDMEITQSHTAAIGQKTVSQSVGLLPPVSSAPGKTTLLPGSQAGMDSSQACSADKTPVRAARDDHLSSGEVVGQPGEATVCAEHDMEITRSHNVPVEENSLRDRQPGPSGPFSSTVLFTSGQADMEMTHVGENTTRVFPEDGSNLVKQGGWEAVPGNRTILFPSAEDMELTRMDTTTPGGELGVHNRGAIPDSPADKTTVFTHDQDDMEITTSHTTAVNNNIHGIGNPCPLKVSPESTQQAALHTALSSGRDEVDSSPVAHLNGECPTDSKDKTSIPSSAPSAPAFPGENRATKAPCGTTPDSIYPASLPEVTVAVQTPQDLPLKGVSVPVSREQHLLPPENLRAKSVSSKLLSGGPLDGREDSSDLVSPVPLQQPDSSRGSTVTGSAQRSQGLEEVSSQGEDPAAASGLSGGSLGPVSNRESKEKEELSAEGEAAPKGLQINSEQTKQLLASENPREQTDPSPAPELSGILNVCSKLKNIRRKSAIFPVSEAACSEQLPRSSAQPEDALRVGKNTGNEHFFHTKEQENTSLESGAAPVDANVAMALQDKYQGIKVPLGIFQPKLPNRRKPSASSVQDLNAKSSGKGGAPPSEGGVNAGDAPGTSQADRQNFSPSQFIAEEFLPVCLEEMDSNESVSSELVESSCREMSKHHISHHEKNQLEETKTCNTKRALEQDEEDLQSLKKVKRGENLDGGDSQDLQVTFGAVSQSQTEAHEGEDPPNQSAKNSDGTHASTSSLDSAKADTELTIQPSSQMESQLLTDSICEDTLREKFQSGLITVGEFLTLLQVHVPIQKPRHSHIPVSCAVSATPTPEDLLYSQFVYGPRVRVYEEDCQALSQKIEELKLYVNVQDKLLVNVNRSLWEVMRSCSDEELRSFGEELNKMKSYFTKESKVLAHNEKEALYSKLMQSAQEQQEKLQSRMEQVDELLKEAESCLLALDPDSNWKGQAADCRDEVAQEKQLEEELENIKAQEEELKRELSDLEVENQQILAQINQRKEEEKSCQDLLETCDFTEWELTEWSEQQAVFSFLYDSLELTVVFGPPIEGDEFGEDPSRQIVSLSFESLLDEEKAPPSSCLVQRLIFQFIESQGCWQEKCPTLCFLSQVLQDISLVVSHCKALGEEIEFLERWGGKFHLLKTDISDTKVKLLFSAAAAFAKFELTLCLSATYPTAPLSFTVQKQIGNIGEEEIAAVLSSVPTGWHYLQRIVSSIAHSLLQGPR